MTTQYRQGDILFVKVDEIPKGAKPKKTDIIVEGEATGHAHRIVNGQILESVERLSYRETQVNMWIIANKAAKVIHEEHGTILLEIGMYMVIRQREYDGKEKNRMVFD